MDSAWLANLGVSLDRRAEVPVGLQLTWALRAVVRSGQLSPGQRLPGARELAEAVGVNVNTLRAVLARLEGEGYLETRHGTGTFVGANPPQRTNLSGLVEDVARAARGAGVEPRDLAGALYTADLAAAGGDAELGQRRELRQQIAMLDRMHAELARARGRALGAPAEENPTRAGAQRRAPRNRGPRLLSLGELEGERDELLDAIASLRAEPAGEPPQPPPPAHRAEQPSSRPSPATRPGIAPA